MSYIPIVKDRNVIEYNISPPEVIIFASHTIWRPSVLPTIQNDYPILIDIESNRLFSTDSHKSESYQKLPYNVGEADHTKILTNPTFRLQNLVEPAVKFQIENNSSAIIAPYFMFSDWRSRKFSVNLELLADTVNHLKALGDVKKPLYAAINISSEVLKSMDGTSYVLERYLEFAEYVEGYIIIPDTLDEKTADVEVLLNLGRLVHGLKLHNKIVRVFPIGSFGIVLQAIGATHYGSGIFGKETSSVAQLDSDTTGFQRDDRWIYDPSIFCYVNAVAYKNAGYVCDCSTCNGGVASSLAKKKEHDAQVRESIGNSLASIPETEKLVYVIDKLKDAIKIAREYSRKGFGPKSTYYLEKWLTVAEAALVWPSDIEQDDELLDDILKEIDG